MKTLRSHVPFSSILTWVLLLSTTAVCIVPFYVMIISSTQSTAELASGFNLLPGKSLDFNYEVLTMMTLIWYGMFNSFAISVPVMLLSAYIGALTGYGFSKFNFKFKSVLFWIVIGMVMVPAQIRLLGLYELHRHLGLLDTHLGIILISIASPQTVFWMKMYTDSSLPDSLIESARLEGCSELRLFHSIILPLLKPALATISIFNFVNIWNNYMTPLVLLFTKKKYPLPIHVAQLNDISSASYGSIYLGITISVIPILLIFSFSARRIVGGLTMGAVKY